jgi:hypothetical protein
MFVCCECFVLSGRGLCDELITPPEESYRVWCVVVCDLEIKKSGRERENNIICVSIMSTRGLPMEVQPNSHRSYLPNNISDQFSA